MGQPDVVIDLGVLPAEELDPMSPRASSPLLRRRFRTSVVAGIAMLCALAMGASVAPPPPFARLLWTAQAQPGLIDLGADTVYIGEYAEGGALTAHRADTGARRWRLALGEIAYGVSENGRGQVVVVSGEQGAMTMLTTAVDIASGRSLNRNPGQPLAHTADGAIYLLNATGLEGMLGSGPVLTAFRPGGGGPAWSRRLAPSTQVWIDRDGTDAARWVVAVGADGAVDVWQPVSGADMGTGRIPVGYRPYGPAAGPISAVVDGRLFSVYEGPGGFVVTAFGLPGLLRQWTTILPRTEGGSSYAFGACGVLLCIRRNAHTEVLDPGSGRLLMRTVGDVYGRVAGGLIAVILFIQGSGETLVVDPATGKQLGEYRGWVVADWPVTGGPLLYRIEGHHMLFARIGSTGHLRQLGRVAGEGLVCDARGETLACLEPSGRLRLWHLRLRADAAPG